MTDGLDGLIPSVLAAYVEPAIGQFFGFIDSGASISSVSIEIRGVTGERDIIGIDDMRWATADVPEPATLLMLGSGLLLLGFRRRL